MKEIDQSYQSEPGIFKKAFSGSKELIGTLTKFELGYVIGFTITGLCITLLIIFLLIAI